MEIVLIKDLSIAREVYVSWLGKTLKVVRRSNYETKFEGGVETGYVLEDGTIIYSRTRCILLPQRCNERHFIHYCNLNLWTKHIIVTKSKKYKRKKLFGK